MTKSRKARYRKRGTVKYEQPQSDKPGMQLIAENCMENQPTSHINVEKPEKIIEEKQTVVDEPAQNISSDRNESVQINKSIGDIEDDEVKNEWGRRKRKTKGTYSDPTAAKRVLRTRFGLPKAAIKGGNSSKHRDKSVSNVECGDKVETNEKTCDQATETKLRNTNPLMQTRNISGKRSVQENSSIVMTPFSGPELNDNDVNAFMEILRQSFGKIQLVFRMFFWVLSVPFLSLKQLSASASFKC
jgi:hypothetical protein